VLGIHQRTKKGGHKELGRLHPLHVPHRKFEAISIDFVTGLEKESSSGHDAILTITCQLTKCVNLVTLKFDGSDAKHTAEQFVANHWKWLFGSPIKRSSDRDPRFTRAFWTTFLALIGSRKSLTTAFHPNANGQAERPNQTMEQCLRSAVNDRGTDWVKCLPMVQYAINDSVHASTGYSPFELVYGERPASGLDHYLTAALGMDHLHPQSKRFMVKWKGMVDAALLRV